MMGTGIGLVDIVILALVGVIFFRLFSVLGRRTGQERPPSDSLGMTEGREKSDDNVITLPDRTSSLEEQEQQEQQEQQEEQEEESSADAALWADDSPIGAGLAQIKIADHQFDPGPFVDGARAAYEMIVTAFAPGDHQTLRNLLSDEVYDNFASAIEAREAASETLETTITTMKAADIVDAGLDGKIAEVTVKFVSDMISVSRDDDGEVIGGTSAEHEVTDIWTFGRDTGSRDPNWTLVATSSEN